MPVIQKYFLSQFMRLYGIMTLGIAIFFSVLHLIDEIDTLSRYDPSLAQICLYLLLIVPRYLLYLLPMSTLICTILVFALASKRREIIAYKASGGNIRALLAPFIVAGVLISFADMALSEFAVPLCNRKGNDLVYRLKEAKKRPTQRQGDIWLKGPAGMILHAEAYVEQLNAFRAVIVFNISGGRASSIVMAEEAVWQGDQWTLRNARRYDLLNNGVETVGELRVSGFESPEMFKRSMPTPEEMGIVELIDYNQRLEHAGYRNKKLSVDILSRMIYPFTCLFMLILGAAVSLGRDMKSGVVGVAAGLIISLLYWFLYSFLLSLGYTGVLPPVLSAFLAPAMFAIAGLLMLRRVPG